MLGIVRRLATRRVQDRRIEALSLRSPWTEQAKQLAELDSSLSEALPKEIFAEASRRGHLIGALDAEDRLEGYLLFRVFRRRATLVHLYVSPQCRRRGAGRALLDSVCSRHRNLIGLSVLYRVGGDAERFWARTGFTNVSQSQYRSADGEPLAQWVLTAGGAGPVDDGGEALPQRLAAAVDDDVFDRFLGPADGEGPRAARALMADWLQDRLAVQVTDELVSEMERPARRGRREEQRKWLKRLPRISASESKTVETLRLLRPFLGPESGAKDRCRRRQLAQALSGEASLFATCDEDLLSASESVFDSFGLRIASPVEIVTRLGDFLEEAQCQPRHPLASTMQRRPLRSSQCPAVVRRFAADEENPGDLMSVLHRALEGDRDRSAWILQSERGEPAALCLEDRRFENCLDIPIFRLSPGRLATTLAQRLLMEIAEQAEREQRWLVRLQEAPPLPGMLEVLEDAGFLREGESYLRARLSLISSRQGLAKQLQESSSRWAAGDNLSTAALHSLRRRVRRLDQRQAAELEHALKPLKLSDCGLPCYVVPIPAAWAAALFDPDLARQELFAEETCRSALCQGVYLRFGNGAALPTPARILWYVRSSRLYSGARSIRACSRLEETERGTAESLYRRFRRLGTYQWKNVLQTARGNGKRNLTAFVFRDTELFRRPIDWSAAKSLLLERNGRVPAIHSPLAIRESEFLEFYRLGMELQGDPLPARTA